MSEEAEPWSTETVLALEQATDALVEKLGVDGNDLAIQKAAARVVAFHGAKDMAGVRAACEEVASRARQMVELRDLSGSMTRYFDRAKAG